MPTWSTSRMPPGSGGATYWGCIFILKNCHSDIPQAERARFSHSPPPVLQFGANISHLEIPQSSFCTWNEAHYGSMREPRQSRTTETIKEAPLTPPSLLKTKYPHRINLEFLLTFTQPIRDAYSMHSVRASVEIFSSALFISSGEDRN